MLEIHELTICRENAEGPGNPLREEIGRAWKPGGERLDSGKFDMVVLDELQLLMTDEGVSADEVAEFLGKCRENFSELVTTNEVPEPLASIADLITEVSETVRTE